MTSTDGLHPYLAAVVSVLPIPDLSDETIALMRSFAIPAELSDAVERTEHRVPGDPEVPLRAHRAKVVGGAPPMPLFHSRRGIRHRQLLDGRRRVRPAVPAPRSRRGVR
jgi:hypothetical protein